MTLEGAFESLKNDLNDYLALGLETKYLFNRKPMLLTGDVVFYWKCMM